MNELILHFQTWLIANSKSPKTIKEYCYHVTKFLLYTGITNAKNVTSEIVCDYITYLIVKKESQQATINITRHAIKSFLDSFQITIQLPKTKSPMRRPVTWILESDFINKIDPLCDLVFEHSLRVKAMLYTLFYSGLRITDACNLTRDRFDFKNNTIKAVITKQNVEKIIPLSARLKPILEKYFISEAQETSAFNLTPSQVRHAFEALQINLDIKINPHMFRRSWATDARKFGMDILDIQTILGHKSISTTLRYIGDVEAEANNKYLKLEAEHLKKCRKENKNKKGE